MKNTDYGSWSSWNLNAAQLRLPKGHSGWEQGVWTTAWVKTSLLSPASPVD